MTRYRKRGEVQYQQLLARCVVNDQFWDYDTDAWVSRPDVVYSHSAGSSRYYRKIETCIDELHEGPPWKSGGPLDIMRGQAWYPTNQRIKSDWAYDTPYGLNRRRVTGTICPSLALPVNLSASRYSKIDLVKGIGDVSSYGPGAYLKFSPVKPQVDLGQFFGEFKEIPRMLKTSCKNFVRLWQKDKRVFKPSNLADEYLNNQFGWVPFLSTMRDFHRVTRSLQRRIKRLIKHNGKWEVRGGPVANRVLESFVMDESNTDHRTEPGLGSLLDAGSHSYQLTSSLTQKVWFKGSYRYYIPKNIDLTNRWPMDLITQIYGLRATPNLVYQLTPWSWLVDWFANIGDQLELADQRATYQLATKYAYIMGTTQRRYDFCSTRIIAGQPHHFRWEGSYTRKQRKHATPYGFDVPYDELSPWKLSILGALGLTKTRSLWKRGGFM